jgi:hypothetical protein
VDRVRRKEHKALKGEGDERLTGTKYHWLRNPVTIDQEDKRNFARLRQSEPKDGTGLGPERNRHDSVQLHL